MKSKILYLNILFIALISLSSCKEKPWKGQEPIKRVNTESKPIQIQWKGVFDLEKGVYASNNFDGGRLNGIIRNNDTLLTALITPENTPINRSPWYAFKLWSEQETEIYVRITYPNNITHRYFPRISHDGKSWQLLDSLNYSEGWYDEKKKYPDFITVKLTPDADTLWLAGQEVITSTHNQQWTDKLAEHAYVTKTTIGKSKEGKPIDVLKIGESNDKKMIVVLSRQHPPELAGYLCMKSFVEKLCANTKANQELRKHYNIYVIPMVNPDGVDKGHWRHSTGGVDLNRDWENFNQPEPLLVKNFMHNKIAENNGKFYIALDFHSTFQDIYYTVDTTLKGNLPGFIPSLIKQTGTKLPNYEPNIKPRLHGDPVSTLLFMFYEFGAETVIMELGDHTSRDFLKLKGEKMAETLAEILNQEE